jgi:hypothetical protein
MRSQKEQKYELHGSLRKSVHGMLSMQCKAPRQGSAKHLVWQCKAHRLCCVRHQGKHVGNARSQLSERHLEKIVQGTYTGQCNAPRQGSSRHIRKAVQGTKARQYMALRLGSTSHIGKASWQGTARHLCKAVQAT